MIKKKFSANFKNKITVRKYLLNSNIRTMRELERRQGMINELVTKEKQMDVAFKNERAEMGR